MELTFLGRGAAFNPLEGNTSAFFIENGELFLIDCGEDVFERLISNKLLENITCINLFITHTHSDHIGSIGTLASYSYHILNKPINIMVPKSAKHLPTILSILSCFGCSNEKYNIIDTEELDNKYSSFSHIGYIETKHSDDVDCYSLVFNTSNGIIYYSGDTRETSIIQSIIDSKQEINKMYVDTTSANYVGNVQYINVHFQHN